MVDGVVEVYGGVMAQMNGLYFGGHVVGMVTGCEGKRIRQVIGLVVIESLDMIMR